MQKILLIAGCTIILVPLLYILSPILLSVLLIIGILILKLNYPQIKGAVGENYVNRLLKQLGPNYTLYHDLYVPNEQGGTTQIDHVITSPFGIFVIETKHYDGWIFGQEHQKYWTQVIYKRKEKLYNPIWQNSGHINALRNYLRKEDFDSIYSIIAFSKNSTLKFKDNFKSARVIQFPQLSKVIKEWNVPRISELELQEFNRALEGLIIKDNKEKNRVKKQHVQALKKILKK